MGLFNRETLDHIKSAPSLKKRRPAGAPGRVVKREWKYLEPPEMARLKNMEFFARNLVEGHFSGRHRSSDFGYSVEFADHRQYTFGDELRTLDWKVYGRSDKLYVKLYEAETNLNVLLLLDRSASMNYGSNGSLTKLEYGCYLCAALAFLMLKQGDRVGMGIFDDEVRTFFRPAGHFSHLYSMLNALEDMRPGRTTKISRSLDKLQPLLKRRGLLVLVSDFLDEPQEIFNALHRYRHRGFEIILFQTLHPDEIDLPDAPNLRFVDLETAGAISAEPRVVRKQYQAEIERFLDEIRKSAGHQRIDYNLVRTDTPYPVVLEKYLLRRKTVTG